jgi:RNase P protein component
MKQRLGNSDARNRCKRLLIELLKDGQKLDIKVIKRVARERHLEWDTVKRAAKELRNNKQFQLVSRSKGFGPCARARQGVAWQRRYSAPGASHRSSRI